MHPYANAYYYVEYFAAKTATIRQYDCKGVRVKIHQLTPEQIVAARLCGIPPDVRCFLDKNTAKVIISLGKKK